MLEISALSVELGGRTALRSVDLKVAAGELVGLIGPNGAGKTTLLRSVLGLVPLQAGDIQVDGVAPVRGHIGYVPQRHEFAWDFPISVERAVMNGRRFGLRRWAGPDDRAAVAEALDQVELTDLRGRPIGELSGGQRQRVLVARALVTRPKVLLLDEPFTGLDVRTQDLLTGLFTSLKKGRALLMTTHDLPAASAMCDRLCLLNKEVIADGPPDELTDPAVWLGAFGVVVR